MGHGFLNPNDPVAISFWIISISMVAATTFFLMESMSVSHGWRTSLNVGALVTLVASVHYFYMREFWITIGTSPILYRYIDWSITVPLQMVEFYFILTAVKSDLGAGMFFRLSWEPWRCWLLVTLARLSSSMLGLDLSSVCAVGHSSCSKSSQVKRARNQWLWVATSRLLSTS